MVDFHWNEIMPVLPLFLRKMISKLSKTIVQFHFYPFVIKSLNACILILCLIFFSKNTLLSPNRSGFRPGSSCINQLLSINHQILSVFNINLEVSGIFVDISKAFDKVQHGELVFELHQNDICDEMISVLEDFLSNRKQTVFLSG